MYQYLNNILEINTILLPVRYSFSRIYNMYFKDKKNNIFNKFNSDRNTNMEKNLGKIVVDMHIFEKYINAQCNYLKDFKNRYNDLKKTNIPIVILDYYYINDNEYLNKKLGNIFNVDFNSLVDGIEPVQRIVKKNFNWFDLFDKNSKEILIKEKEKYEIEFEKEFKKFLEEIGCTE